MFRSLVILLALAVVPAAMTPALGQALMTPAALTEHAPPVYKVKFDTSKGPFEVEVHRDWAPAGADRFYNLVKNGFFDNTRFFRVVSGFMVQFVDALGELGESAAHLPCRNRRRLDFPDRLTQVAQTGVRHRGVDRIEAHLKRFDSVSERLGFGRPLGQRPGLLSVLQK